MSVTARLRPTSQSEVATPPGSSNTPAASSTPYAPLLLGTYVTFGTQSFYVTHLRDGVEMAHSQQEWNEICASSLKELWEEMQAENPTLANPEAIKEVELNFQGRSTVILNSQGQSTSAQTPQFLKVGRLTQKHFTALSRALKTSTGRPALKSFGFKTVYGNYHQGNTPLIQDERYHRACTAINLQFAQEALLLLSQNGDNIDASFIDEVLEQGQRKHGDGIRPRMQGPESEAGITSFYDAHNSNWFPLLQRGDPTTVRLSNVGAKNEILQQLERLRAAGGNSSVFVGITDDQGESFGVQIYKDQNGSLTEAVYFDSHSHKDINGHENACVKRFTSLGEVAEFLAVRVARSAEITMSPFILDLRLIQFLTALGAYKVEKEAERDSSLQLEALQQALRELLNRNQPLGTLILQLLLNPTEPDQITIENALHWLQNARSLPTTSQIIERLRAITPRPPADEEVHPIVEEVD